jgi:DNA-binding MarR family transcriptional regulator
VQVLTLTALGRKSFKAMAERHEGWIAELFAGLDQPEIGQLFRLLGQTKASLHRAIAARANEASKSEAGKIETGKGDA